MERVGQCRGKGGACERVSLRQWPGGEKTYLRRLNKTSLCQTIQGMAGHSLCGVDGREGGRGGRGSRERYEEEEEVGGGGGMEG